MIEFNNDLISKIVIIGSYRKNFDEIISTRRKFIDAGLDVLSPISDEIENSDSGFIILKGDESSSPSELQNIVFNKIEQADLLYVCNNNKYIGFLTAVEIGYAIRNAHLIYFSNDTDEAVMKELVNGRIISVDDLIDEIKEYNYNALNLSQEKIFKIKKLTKM